MGTNDDAGNEQRRRDVGAFAQACIDLLDVSRTARTGSRGFPDRAADDHVVGPSAERSRAVDELAGHSIRPIRITVVPTIELGAPRIRSGHWPLAQGEQ